MGIDHNLSFCSIGKWGWKAVPDVPTCEAASSQTWIQANVYTTFLRVILKKTKQKTQTNKPKTGIVAHTCNLHTSAPEVKAGGPGLPSLLNYKECLRPGQPPLHETLFQTKPTKQTYKKTQPPSPPQKWKTTEWKWNREKEYEASQVQQHGPILSAFVLGNLCKG